MPKEIKRKNKAIHPNSRAACHLARKLSHEKRVERRYKEKATKLDILGDKLKWFHDHIDDGKTSYTKAEACQLIEQYLNRFNEELEQIALINSMKGRSGSQHVSRQQAIKITLEKERREFEESGFEIPDITRVKNYKVFREWTGEMRYIQNIKMMKFIKPPSKESNDKEKTDVVPWVDDVAVSFDDDATMTENSDNKS